MQERVGGKEPPAFSHEIMEMFYNEYEIEEADGVVTNINSEHTVDLIRHNGSVGQWEIFGIGKTLDKRIFSVANLQ